MPFEQDLFREYKRVMETTRIQACYQQIIRLIKYISSQLEKEMPEYTFEFEVWISGYNRKIQCSYYERLRHTQCPFEVCANPERTDFIIKAVVEKTITTDAPETIIAEIKSKIVELEEHMKKYQRLETTAF